MSAPGFGSNIQVTPPGGWPVSIPASGSWVSQPTPLNGPGLTVGVLLAGNGNMSIQRYLDLANKLPIGAAVTATLTGGTANSATVNDGSAALYAVITLTDTSGSTNAVRAISAAADLQGH